MLYLIYKQNHELAYRDGQEAIIHLQADLYATVAWAEKQAKKRWAFTTSNAGSFYFEDYCKLEQLSKIDWAAVQTNQWANDKERKQAEFLIEHSFPWHLIEQIGVASQSTYQKVIEILQKAKQKPRLKIERDWYY